MKDDLTPQVNPMLIECTPLDYIRLQCIIDLCNQPEREQLKDDGGRDTMGEEVVEFSAHLKDLLRGVVRKEFICYLEDQGFIIRGWDRCVVIDGFTTRGC